MRASRLRWSSQFHLTGNFNILTLDHIRLLRGSRCDRTGFKAGIQNSVATLAIHLSLPKKLDEKVSKLQLIVLGAVLTVLAQVHADYIGQG